MKKTVVTPSDILNKKIVAQAKNADGYANKINSLPDSKKSHKVLWVVSTLAACLAVAVGLGIYLRAPKTPWYNELAVGDEIFEKYLPSDNGTLSTGNRFYPDYDDVETYFEESDLVIIGYPENTFTSDKHEYYSRENGFVDINGDWYTLDTIRKIKVLDVLKGEIDTDSINLHVKEVAIWKEDGSYEIKEFDSEHFIQKKNVKYIFFLSETKNLLRGEKTYYCGYDSCINVDGLHTDSLNKVTYSFFCGVFEKYIDYFIKYNRSAEADVIPDRPYLYTEDGHYFENEAEAYDYSDLIIIGSAVNDFTDDTRIAIDGKIITTDKEASEYHRDEVFTLRNINVLNVLKGDKALKTVYIPNGMHYYYSRHTKASELWYPSSKDENPMLEKESVYLFYLKRDDTLGENVYRLSGKECISELVGGGVSAKRLYEMYMRHINEIKEYLPK